jgi:serine/threonine-protein kinase RsbW
VRTRFAATTLVGGSLVALVAVATLAVAWLLWTRAEDRKQIEDERAAQTANEALQNSVGRVVTSLRASAGLVDTQGAVDEASFGAYARAVGSIGATDALALAEIVTSAQRKRFEAMRGARIIEFVRPGMFRPAGQRAVYVPIVAIWPEGGARSGLLGFDLMSEPARRSTLARARSSRGTAFTGLIRFVTGGRGFQTLRPIYAPTGDREDPVGYVSAWFSTRVISAVLARLPSELRVRVSVDGTEAYATDPPPSGGSTRSLMLGGRRWVVTASGGGASHSSSLAILVGGAILAVMLGAFALSRASSERRLRAANDAERAARERSELLERNASHLAAAGGPQEVAASTVADLAAAGIEVAAVRVRRGDAVETLAAVGPAEDVGAMHPVADEAMRVERVVEASGSELRPDRARLESVLAVPFLGARGEAVGALVAGSRRRGWLVPDMRAVVVGVAEQCGVALERARLSSIDDEAHRRADILQRLVASLSAAALPTEVAEACIPFLFEAFDAVLCTVGVASGDDVRTLKVPAKLSPEAWRWRPVPLSASTPTADAMRARHAVELHGRERVRALYPPEIEQLLAGVVSMVVVPLSHAIGAVGVAFAEDRRLSEDERKLLNAIADELGQALERAALLESERDARRQAELMERHAARLAAATTVTDVATATVAEFEAFGADVVFVWRSSDTAVLETLAASDMPEETRQRFAVYPLELGGLVSDAMRSESLVAIESGEAYDTRYPALAEERRRLGVESLVALPLRTASGALVGAIFAAAARARWITDDRRPLLNGIAEQTGVALERAELQAAAERTADATTFLALVGESLEQATTVSARARRLVEALTEERATFAAVHLIDEDGAASEVASGGSRPAELEDDELWAEWVAITISTGRETSPGRPGGDAGSGLPSLLVLPLRARGHSLGALTIRSAAGADWRPVTPPALAREIAGRAAIALDNALLYERERDVSHTLQLGLLGGGVPSFDGVVVVAAYRPGTAALEVGGDWYDAFTLQSGAIALVVGDVVGHGLEAAVAMGQLRGAVSALAQTAGPALLLERLDAFVETVPSAATATLAYVELDTETGRLRYACAGHPPPLVVSPDGRTRFLWEGRSAPLGSMLGDTRGEAVERLEDGETLVLYTDGLVERRSASIDVGLERLAGAARLHALGAPALASDLCDQLLGGQVQDDDVCVLSIHRIPTVRMFSHSFLAAPSELAELRERLRSWLAEHGVEEDVERGVVLAASEAASNAVEHGYGCDGAGIVTVLAQLHDDGRLELSVRDEGTWREAPSDTDRGRGLSIMQAIVEELSIEREDGATVLRMSQSAREPTSA